MEESQSHGNYNPDLVSSYPKPPWNLKGSAILILNLLDISNVRQLIPPELEIVSVLPNKTLGSIYLSVYNSGSVLQYNELIVVAGLTKYQNHIGSWISHIYVDNEISVAGGREIWGLPKEMAEFVWQDNRVTVSQDNRLLCSLDYNQSWWHLNTWWQQMFNAQSFSGFDKELLLFENNFSTKLGLLSGKLTVPVESPFSYFNLAHPWLTISMNNLDLIANKPEIIGEKTPSNIDFS